MDTIVTVYKSPDLASVRIEAEHPLEAAKRALAAIDLIGLVSQAVFSAGGSDSGE